MKKKGKKKKYLSLGKTKHILDTFCFLLQVCRYLIEAAKSGDVNTTKRWAHCDSDRCIEGGGNRHTPLILAIYNDHLEVVRVLLEGGADVQRGDVVNWNALHEAASKGRLGLCRLLLDWGAKVNTEWLEKKTALHEAAWYGHLLVVQLLVKRGADVSVKNAAGLTAAEFARRAGHTGVADWLDSVSRV
jgi:ankyrin repeat protein